MTNDIRKLIEMLGKIEESAPTDAGEIMNDLRYDLTKLSSKAADVAHSFSKYPQLKEYAALAQEIEATVDVLRHKIFDRIR